MKFATAALALTGILVLSGCCRFEQQRFNDIAVGMTRGQVESRLCQPEWASVEGGAEVLHYRAETGERFFVRLKDGVVEDYGRGLELLRQPGPREPTFRVIIKDD